VPSLTALLSNSARQVVGYLSPFLGAVEVHQLKEQPVLYICPRTLYESWVENLLPSVEALHICSTAKSFCNLLPVFTSVDSDSFGQFLVFNLSPVTLDLDVVSFSMVLGSLVLGWPSLVEMRVQHLMPDKFLLSFAVSQIIQIVRTFNFLNFFDEFILCLL
jgi:hypothetical protein